MIEKEDIILNIKLLQEQQRILESRLKDVDECCGKLKGSTSIEQQKNIQRLSTIEQQIQDKDHDLEINIVKTQKELELLNKAVSDIQKTYNKLSTGTILALITALIGILLHTAI